MRLLFIRTTGGMSGVERYNVMLLNALQKQKDISVHLLTNFKPFLQRLKQKHIPSSLIYHPIPEAGTKKELLLAILWFYPMLFVYLSKIKQIEGKKRFDTIILESMTEKLFLSPYLKLLGYHVIWIEHGPLFITDRSPLVKKLYVYKSTRPDAILAVSEDTKRDLIRGGVSARKIRVVHIGIEKIASPAKRDRNDKKRWTIGFLGSVTEEKGIREFLNTAYAITQNHAYASFCVIGGGPLLGWARHYAQKLKIQKNIVFTGYVEDVTKYLAKIDILYFPTHHHEGISLALLEALAQGKIVVARDIGGNRELIIDKKTGYLFRTKEEGEKILEKIIMGKLPVENIRKSALKHIRKNFLLKTQIPKFIDIFHD